MAIDTARLQRICEEELTEHIGPVAFIVADDLVRGANFVPHIPDGAQLSAFVVALRNGIPADLPREAIAQRILKRYAAQ